ncbi:putative dienelactone hydrolase [Bradyrhizobium elkanii]|uniref:alpha/beta hydrolase family protein n=1 Tax=Bradyrhizobium TaxID=374 RepID=UPI00216997EF|nr:MULTISPECIES: dienelactone hydrolase [Bradyrhizobium]MCS3930051.1 putative dienelactone hydrolase [Bradyrhizobium elkanii]MCS3970608.1 putative dienelactone hydrolase [Bradyrhizobium japonicum]
MFRPRLGGLILIVVACLAATLAHAAGLGFIEVPAEAGGPALTGMVWTPCAAPPSEVALDGGVVLPGVKDCPVAGNRLPLIVVSHGRRGSFLGHIDTATALADAGFVVAAINHPGDTARDSSRTDEFSVLVERPADMKRLTDFMLGAWKEAAVLDPKRVGLFGFSRGAYTGLVVIGGNPDFGALAPLCDRDAATTPKCQAIRDGLVPTEAAVHDSRIRAAVLADPPLYEGLFNRERLANVTIPILLWRSALGGDGVVPASVDTLEQMLPARPDFRIVPNSSHFSFLAPCPPKLAEAAPILCTDPPGFDRKAFHSAFNDAAVSFFRTNLK